MSEVSTLSQEAQDLLTILSRKVPSEIKNFIAAYVKQAFKIAQSLDTSHPDFFTQLEEKFSELEKFL